MLGYLNRLHLEASVEALYRNAPIAVLAASFALILLWFPLSQTTTAKVTSMRDPIPYVFNTVQFLTDNDSFMSRVT
jgi:hypothetical protein